MDRLTTKQKRLLFLAALGIVLGITALLIVETFRLLLPGLWTAFRTGDEQALSAYLNAQGQVRSFLVLWFLCFVQVLSILIPLMPVELAAGIAYGPWWGFLSSFSASVTANLLVFLVAKRLSRAILVVTADSPKIQRMLGSIRSSRDPWFYTILAFLTPGLPNGIIPYAAAQAGMTAKHFLGAVLISLPLPNLLTCAAGSFLVSGDWTFSILLGLALYTFVGVLFFKRSAVMAWVHRRVDIHRTRRQQLFHR